MSDLEENLPPPAVSLPPREIDDPPPSPVERAETQPPPADVPNPHSEGLIEARPAIAPDFPPLDASRDASQPLPISERAAEISEQLQEIPPPPTEMVVSDVAVTSEAQSELIELWRALGQLGTAFTDLSTRVGKLETFLGLKG